jgi:hypothetical protein
MAEHAFRSAGSDEDGGNQANIAASGASNRYSAMREQHLNNGQGHGDLSWPRPVLRYPSPAF